MTEMMETSPDDASGNAADIRKWIALPETSAHIEKIAGGLAKKNKQGLISLQFAGIRRHDEIDQNLIQTIASELVLFLIENRSNIQKIIAGAPYPGRLLQHYFICFCRDKARSPQSDTFRYLFKRSADILRAADEFYTSAESTHPKAPKISVFSMRKDSRKIPPMTAEDFSLIPFPEALCPVEYSKVNRSGSIKKLAAYFWDQVTATRGMPVQIDIRDFISWLAMHIAFPDIHPKETDFIEKEDQIMDPATASVQQICSFDPELIEKWAKNFASRLSEKDRAVFFLRYHDSLDFTEIAAKTGYKGPSGPKERLNIIENKLRSFLRPLPWLSPDGECPPDETAFELFLELLNKNLKNSLQSP